MKVVEMFVAVDTLSFLNELYLLLCRLFIIYIYYFHLGSIYYRTLDVNHLLGEKSILWGIL
jgi:hypothetical protein